jgi:hypothetical protein
LSPCFEAHHETTPEHLVLCHGNRFDIVLNGYLPKKPKDQIKPKQCKFCRHFIGYCELGYGTTALTPACRQAAPRKREKP